MKLRHVRAAAVFAIAVVALTGARGSHGGSCGGGSSHGSSSSSGSGGSTSGGTSGDSTGGTFGGSTTGGTTSSGTTSGTTSGTSGDSTTSGGSSTLGSSGGSGSRNSAMRDIKIVDCAYTDRLGITAKLSATNSSSTLTYDYRLTVKFTGPDGALLSTRNPSIMWVGPGKTSNLDVSTPYVPKAGGPTSGGKCEVTNVTRTINGR
ncbi:hypothetical protein [Streptomyces albireticuli]|uniref:Secreted protein n=1 Tax=Streptomyces albireticuli TaxID=1940 RepID=A0A2A2DAW9_9ACTN|nr:hypothetical protein [Streptomyces albireticuli]MCD9144187.1 hypothetical protein [Streptomyces albireticuli]MCD9162170.1 hypothetical protein [Streptomyces albireticuli]MCD9193824.1 hypothetical protein [Streptomyces albireticuli]PAU48675.1 hypothetical protein CK936_11970 [Streptomyces albireticuli]